MLRLLLRGATKRAVATRTGKTIPRHLTQSTSSSVLYRQLARQAHALAKALALQQAKTAMFGAKAGQSGAYRNGRFRKFRRPPTVYSAYVHEKYKNPVIRGLPNIAARSRAIAAMWKVEGKAFTRQWKRGFLGFRLR